MQADDYFAIQNLIYRYASLIDTAQFDAVGQMFAQADFYIFGKLEARQDPVAVAKTYKDWVRIYPDGTPRTRHVMSNVIIEPDGTDRAKASTYVMVFQQTDVLPLQPVIGGDYHDRFAKVDGVWRFTERRMDNNLFGNLTQHGKDPTWQAPERT